MTEPLLLRVRSAAALLDCSSKRLYDLISRGAVPAIRLGNGNGGLRVPMSALKQMIEDRLQKAEAERNSGGTS